MKIGMNLLLWTAELNEGVLPAVRMLKELGYDGVEVPLFNYDLDYSAWGRRLDEEGLARTAVTIRGPADNPISSDPAVRRAGIEGNKRAVDCCVALGATHLVGPFHSALGQFSGAGPTADEWRWGIDSMREVSRHAAGAGVVLGIECLNRFETYLLTSHAEAARFAREVGEHCHVMYDTFHANIEEKNIAAAIGSCADRLAHVHISENDRSTPGSGGIRWDETFSALNQFGYDGWLMVEAFGLALPEIAAATKIWRRMYENEEQLARDAIGFIKTQVAKHWE